MEGLVNFISALSLGQILAYFWPFFLLDMLRYVIIEAIVVAQYLLRKDPLEHRKARKILFQQRPLVSILVPGKNEGRHLPKLVQRLEKQTYKHFELIVVDDGSDDNTPQICRRLEQQGKIHRFIRNQVRGGKASGANTALRFARGQYVIHIDADSHLKADSIETILLPFIQDRTIGAVGGDVRVANEQESFATRLQAIEYLKTITAGRVTSSELGILRIISGAHGAFRRDVLDQIEGWDVGPGLDGDITLKVRKLGYKVVHVESAVCYTNVPSSFKKLAKQRYRWDKSMVRFRLRKHIDVLSWSSNFRGSTFFSVLENLLFNLVFDIKWFVYFIFMLFTSPAYLGYVFVINYILYSLANLCQFILAYKLTNRGEISPTLWLFIPLMPAYTGIYLRAIRTYAYLMEFLHKTSYDDPWNPWKVSRIAKRNKL